ncbi:MAG: phosphotransferase [Deltaproteobacteria bacterium]|nr:phosphotransferase [Deltaproteobacteria bacterium]
MPSKPISEALPDPTLKQALTRFLEKREHHKRDVMMEPIPADGSTRHFSRLISAAGDALAVVMVNPPSTPMAERENLAYLNIGRHLSEKGLCVPEIYGYHLESGWFIMEDLGNRHLQDVVLSQTDFLPIYRDVLEQLVRLQIRGAEDFDSSWCCQTEVYDLTVMRRYESDYFRDAFLRGYLGLNDTGSELESAFVHLAENASKADCRFFLHRDFQSRNILISGKKIGLVDWQGGGWAPWPMTWLLFSSTPTRVFLNSSGRACLIRMSNGSGM